MSRSGYWLEGICENLFNRHYKIVNRWWMLGVGVLVTIAALGMSRIIW